MTRIILASVLLCLLLPAAQAAPPSAEVEKEVKKVPSKKDALPAQKPKEETLPEDPALLYQMAKESYKAGNFLRASMLFERAYSKDPNPTLLLNSAHMRVKAGDYLGAADLYRQVFSNSEISEAVRNSAQKKLSEIIPYLSYAWLRFSPELQKARCVLDEAVVDTSSGEPQKVNPGVHLVGWSLNPGEYSFVVKRLIAGATETIDGKLESEKLSTLSLKPSLPGTRVLRLGTMSIALPKGTARVQTPMPYSGEVVLMGPDGTPMARRVVDLGPGEKLDWAWSEPAKPIAAPTAQAEVEDDFPWTWVIVGSVTAAAAIGATAYFMTQPADDPGVTATQYLD